MDSLIFPLSLDSSSLLSLSSLYIYGTAVYSIVRPPRDMFSELIVEAGGGIVGAIINLCFVLAIAYRPRLVLVLRSLCALECRSNSSPREYSFSQPGNSYEYGFSLI